MITNDYYIDSIYIKYMYQFNVLRALVRLVSGRFKAPVAAPFPRASCASEASIPFRFVFLFLFTLVSLTRSLS